VEAARLEELRLAAQEALAELRLAGGGHAELVGELEALVAAHPLWERPRGQLMLALYRSGRQADALRVYGETRATLAEELGIDPSPELQRLQRAILTQDPAIAPPGRARAPAAPPHNLPERLTSLVGRDRELDEVGKLVGQHRLVTVTGPGGAGKTSLAVEAARRLVAGFPDGAWLVELAALAGPGLLAETVAATLGLREEPGPRGPPRRQWPTGWPASSATRSCWWSWTTASTWWPAAPSWSCGCCGPPRGCGCWPPAARSLGCRGSWSGRSRPWPSPTRHRAGTRGRPAHGRRPGGAGRL
jgi:hypothetical protein